MSRLAFAATCVGLAALFTLTGYQLFLGDQLGSDYTFFLPRLLYGYYWQVENGLLSVPWFTPAFCGGLPFYADPQVMYFSLPQMSLWLLDPQQAVFLTYLVAGAVGAIGSYLLLRHFGVSSWLALAGTTLFLFNEFFLYRMLMGHLTYHVFPLVPLISLWLAKAAEGSGNRSTVLILLSGVMIAVLVHGGAMNFVVPAMLSVGLLLAVNLMLRGTGIVDHLRVILAAGLVGLLLSLSKIVAGYAFVRSFPRETLSLGIFDGASEAIFSVFTMLFMNPWITLSGMESGYLIQAQELRFGVTLAPLIMVLIGLAAVPGLLPKINGARLLALSCILMVAALPIVLSVRSEAIDGMLKTLPYFREMSLAVRWLALLIMPVIVISILLVQALTREMSSGDRLSVSVSVGCILLVVISHLMTEKPWDVPYDPAKVIASYHNVSEGGGIPSVSTVTSQPDNPTFSGADDDFIDGGTSKVCYQPVFGYRLEQYPIGSLHDGSVFARSGDRLNLKNPACYVYPGANDCKPGDHFRVSEEEAASRFATNQEFDFEMPGWQQAANWLNLLSVLAVMLSLGVLTVREVLLSRR